MEIMTRSLYFVSDDFFAKIQDPYQKINYKDTRHPHYFALKDSKTGLYWLGSCSSKIEKFERLIQKKQEQHKLTDTIKIVKTFGCCRFVYNRTLAYKSVSKTDCNNYCNRELKKECEWLKEVDKFALTNAIYNMDSAYQKFFKEHASYPKFKSRHEGKFLFGTRNRTVPSLI